MSTYPAEPIDPETMHARQRERRDEIVRAALRSLGSDEYENIKIAKVAQNADVALATVYRYFSSKEHLFAEAVLVWQGALRRKIEKARTHPDSEEEAVRDLMHRHIRAFEVQPQFLRAIVQLSSSGDPYARRALNELRGESAKILETMIGRDLDDELAAIYYTVTAVLDSSLREWLSGRFTIEQVYRQVDASIGLIYRPKPGRVAESHSH
jgi:AcrR family transcriptional regulator